MMLAHPSIDGLSRGFHHTLAFDEPSRDEKDAVMTLSSFGETLPSIRYHSPTNFMQKPTAKRVRRPNKHPKKNKIKIPVHEIVRFLLVPQPIAAEKLGVSISTLKRRYYELDWGRWPSTATVSDSSDTDCSDGESSNMPVIDTSNIPAKEKTKISFMTNCTNATNTTNLDTTTLKVLQCAFKQYFSE